LGHIYRSLAIAKQLSAQDGTNVRFSANTDEAVLKLLSGSDFPFEARASEDISGLDVPQADLWMVDVPEFGAEYVKKLQQSWPETRVIAMDYQEYDAAFPDAIINLFDQNPDGSRPPGSVKYHEGIEYGIIREEFAAYRHRPASTGPSPKVLVIFGSSDVRNCTATVIEASGRVKGHKPAYEVVLGPNVQNRATVISKMNDSESQVSVHDSPPNLAEVMAGCSLAICAGGTTMMELAYLGIPAIVIAQTDVEDRLARILADRGTAIALDMEQGSNPQVIAETLGSLLSDPERLKSMRANGQRAIDGLGVDRILEIIDRTLAVAA